MSRYDRYVLSQYLLFFGFFALVLVGVTWINRAVVLFDRLIGSGQSAMVFLEFSALALPNLIRMIVPMAAFVATLFITNRLIRESEITVMQATGSSPWRLARPALVFGVLLALGMSILTHLLLPASIKQLGLREAEVARNISARLLTEGSFLHPAPGVTFYIRQIDADGTLNDVFLADRRAPATTVIYTASRAFLVRDRDTTTLIMVDGLAQRMDNRTRRLSTTLFSDFSYDISALVRKEEKRARNPSAIPTLELLFDTEMIAEREGLDAGKLTEVLHQRFARALVVVPIALIGFSALLLGGHSRFGVWRQGLLAFVVMISMELLRGVLADVIRANTDLWALNYLPAALGMVVATVFLHFAGRPLSPRQWIAHRRGEVVP